VIKTTDLYDLEHTLAGEYLAGFEFPWQMLPNLGGLIRNLGAALKEDYREKASGIWIHRTASVARTAVLQPPCILGPRTEVRHCAYIRGAVLTGADCVIGNSSEVKNAILFDRVQIPHLNYVGDSILGYAAHLGAGAVISNLKADAVPVSVKTGNLVIPTGMRKLGAMVGDYVEIGCNSVLNPGTVVGRHSRIYPGCCVRGVIPAGHILKENGSLVSRE